MTATVARTGPLFDGRALRHSEAMRTEIVDVVAQDAFHEVGAALGAMLKNPTGYYQSRIAVSLTRDSAVVHDSGVIYGPWLAGVSSRNEKSRFKGYTHWLRARQRAEANAARTAQPVVTRRVRGMN